MPTRDQVITYARTLLGTAFKHQGRLPGVGLDCSGTIVVIGRQFNIPHEDELNYSRQPDGASFKASMDRWLTPIPTDQIREASIILCRVGRHPKHCALITPYHAGGWGMLHAESEAGVAKVVEHVLTDRWVKRIVQAYDIPGVT